MKSAPLTTEPSTPPQPEHRQRLLEAMALTVAAKGYADTTIADVVSLAAVSRRTFYQYFTTKAECLIALHQTSSRNALQVLRCALNPQRHWQTQVEQALAAYFACLAQNPVLLRTLFIEIHGLGAAGLASRRRANEQLAALMLEVVNADANRREPLQAAMAMAVVGGIHEWVLALIEQDRLVDLPQLAAQASALVLAVARE